MDTPKERARLEKKLLILDMIETAECKIRNSESYIKIFGNLFPRLAEKARHEIEIHKMAIERLEKRFNEI